MRKTKEYTTEGGDKFRTIIPKVYYAHNMLHYGSNIEAQDIEMLEAMGFEVVNPNHIDNESEYLRTRDFGVFLRLVEGCDILAFRSIMHYISKGVAKEISFAKEHGMPVIELPTLTQDRFLTTEETIEYCRPKPMEVA